MGVRPLTVVPLLCIWAQAASLRADNGETAFTLYRDSWVSQHKRIHVATFDAAQSPTGSTASFNADACNQVARMLNEQPGTVSRYWCEVGRYRADLAGAAGRRARPRGGESPRRRADASCNSAVAARTSTPEELATACSGWSPQQIARAEARFLSGMCKADSVPDCERLCVHAPAELPRRERTQLTDWACRRRAEIIAHKP
jgi:hypothetical protein